MVVSISESLLMEINPEVELDSNVGIQEKDCSDFDDGLARVTSNY